MSGAKRRPHHRKTIGQSASPRINFGCATRGVTRGLEMPEADPVSDSEFADAVGRLRRLVVEPLGLRGSFRRVLVNVSTSTNSGTGECLFGHWKLDEGAGVTTADATTNNVTGTLLNGPVWTSGKSGQALAFDGVNDRVGLGMPF